MKNKKDLNNENSKKEDLKDEDLRNGEIKVSSDKINPKLDFAFKKIFGSEKRKNILISFLHGVLKPSDPIEDVSIIENDIVGESEDDKQSRLDIKARLSSGELINIEIQVRRDYEMGKRTMYYWSRMFSDQLNKKEAYSKLVKTICINVLDFNYLSCEEYHSCYKMLERERYDELTDVVEIHFIETKKLKYGKNVKDDLLVRWIKFLNNPYSEETKKIGEEVEEVKEAMEELVRMENNPIEKLAYEARLKYVLDKNSAEEYHKERGIQIGLELGLQKGREEGIEFGMEQNKMEIAKKMIKKGIYTYEDISEMTGLDIKEIEKLK